MLLSITKVLDAEGHLEGYKGQRWPLASAWKVLEITCQDDVRNDFKQILIELCPSKCLLFPWRTEMEIQVKRSVWEKWLERGLYG